MNYRERRQNWPEQWQPRARALLPICHWGCGITSYVDCGDAEMWAVDPNPAPHGAFHVALFPQHLSLTEWMHRWLRQVAIAYQRMRCKLTDVRNHLLWVRPGGRLRVMLCRHAGIRGGEPMTIGPVQLIVLGFNQPDFHGDASIPGHVHMRYGPDPPSCGGAVSPSRAMTVTVSH